MDWRVIGEYLLSPRILDGFATTVWLSIVSMAIGVVIGLGVALMRLSHHRLFTTPSALFIWLFQGTPLLLQLIVIYTALPQLGIKLNVVTCVLLGLGLNEGAYLAETFRGGISSIPKGQIEASRALGMRYFVMLHRVVLPQAARVIIPDAGNRFNGLMKATSLASAISMEELLRTTQEISESNFRILELFTIAAVYYLLLSTLWGIVQRRLESHYGKGI